VQIEKDADNMGKRLIEVFLERHVVYEEDTQESKNAVDQSQSFVESASDNGEQINSCAIYGVDLSYIELMLNQITI